MTTVIYPYKPFSESSKALAEALGIKRISHRNSKFKGNQDKIVINWGASNVPEEVLKCRIINHPDAVSIAANKLLTFDKLKPAPRGRKKPCRKVKIGDRVYDSITFDHEIFDGIPDDHVGPWEKVAFGVFEVLEPKPKPVEDKPFVRIPSYTANKDEAQYWLDDGHIIVERHILNGNSGAGIRLVDPQSGDELQDAPLYVMYIPKKQEYRVHVCNGAVADIQRKARRQDIADEDIDWRIRNHDNGFIFARGEALGYVPDDVLTNAVNAVKCIGLDFGAVDIIYNERRAEAYVLEVNTAPGLSGTTLEGYAARFKDLLNGVVPAEPIVAGEALVEAPKLRRFDAAQGVFKANLMDGFAPGWN